MAEDFEFENQGDASGDYEFTTVNRLRIKSHIMILDRPCIITHMTHAKPGKHGSMKAIIGAEDIFTKKNHVATFGSADSVKVPIVKNIKYTVCDIDGENISLMDESLKMDDTNNLPDDEMGKKILELYNSGKTVCVTIMYACGESKIIDCSEAKE